MAPIVQKQQNSAKRTDLCKIGQTVLNFVEIDQVAHGRYGLRPQRRPAQMPLLFFCSPLLEAKIANCFFGPFPIFVCEQTECHIDVGSWCLLPKKGLTLHSFSEIWSRRGLVAKGRHRANCCTKLGTQKFPFFQITFVISLVFWWIGLCGAEFWQLFQCWTLYLPDRTLPVTLIVLDYQLSNLLDLNFVPPSLLNTITKIMLSNELWQQV